MKQFIVNFVIWVKKLGGEHCDNESTRPSKRKKTVVLQQISYFSCCGWQDDSYDNCSLN